MAEPKTRDQGPWLPGQRPALFPSDQWPVIELESQVGEAFCAVGSVGGQKRVAGRPGVGGKEEGSEDGEEIEMGDREETRRQRDRETRFAVNMRDAMEISL